MFERITLKTMLINSNIVFFVFVSKMELFILQAAIAKRVYKIGYRGVLSEPPVKQTGVEVAIQITKLKTAPVHVSRHYI